MTTHGAFNAHNRSHRSRNAAVPAWREVVCEMKNLSHSLHKGKMEASCRTPSVSAPCCRPPATPSDRKSTRLNSSHVAISYAVFCLKKKTNQIYNSFSI